MALSGDGEGGGIHTVELYRKVRLACRKRMSERAAAKHFGFSRESVRNMLRFSVPPGYRRTVAVSRPKSLSKADAAAAAGAVFSTIADALVRGETVTIAGFGKCAAQDRAARTGRNPRIGEAVPIAAVRVPPFTAGKALRDAVNE